MSVCSPIYDDFMPPDFLSSREDAMLVWAVALLAFALHKDFRASTPTGSQAWGGKSSGCSDDQFRVCGGGCENVSGHSGRWSSPARAGTLDLTEEGASLSRAAGPG